MVIAVNKHVQMPNGPNTTNAVPTATHVWRRVQQFLVAVWSIFQGIWEMVIVMMRTEITTQRNVYGILVIAVPEGEASGFETIADAIVRDLREARSLIEF